MTLEELRQKEYIMSESQWLQVRACSSSILPEEVEWGLFAWPT
jgi:hypothetical protein